MFKQSALLLAFSLAFFLFFSTTSSAQCLQQCEDAREKCVDSSPLGLSYSNYSKTLSTQALDSPDFTTLENTKLCSKMACSDARDACTGWAVNIAFKACVEDCEKRNCNSTAHCTLSMREKLSQCSSSYISCCQEFTSTKCAPEFVACKQACPPETFSANKTCSNSCPAGEAQKPFPDCSCVSPPSAIICGVEGTAEAKKSTSAEWVPASLNALLARGDSVRTSEATMQLGFASSCAKPFAALKQNSALVIWDYSESAQSKNQVILLSSGKARVVSSSDFLVHARAQTGWFAVRASPESDYAVEAYSGSARIKAIIGAITISKPGEEQTIVLEGNEAIVWQTKNTTVAPFNVEQELEAWREKKQGETNWTLYAIILAIIISAAAIYFYKKKKKEEDAY